jgi:hypothetical protein
MDVIEFIFAFVMLVTVGTFALLFPISRRLGRIMEEWIQLRRGSLPERDTIDRMEKTLEAISHRLESMDQRVDLVGERQEFMESLMEQQRLTGPSSDPA